MRSLVRRAVGDFTWEVFRASNSKLNPAARQGIASHQVPPWCSLVPFLSPYQAANVSESTPCLTFRAPASILWIFVYAPLRNSPIVSEHDLLTGNPWLLSSLFGPCAKTDVSSLSVLACYRFSSFLYSPFVRP